MHRSYPILFTKKLLQNHTKFFIKNTFRKIKTKFPTAVTMSQWQQSSAPNIFRTWRLNHTRNKIN